MNKWTEKNLLGLRDTGKIRGFHFKKMGKNIPQNQVNNIPAPRSKALLWLDMNLQLWANDHALTLETEYRFSADRKYRFDYAFAAVKIAVEFEGGIYLQNSGHNTARHYTKDTDKYNLATVTGWRVIRVTAMNYTTVLKSLNDLIK